MHIIFLLYGNTPWMENMPSLFVNFTNFSSIIQCIFLDFLFYLGQHILDFYLFTRLPIFCLNGEISLKLTKTTRSSLYNKRGNILGWKKLKKKRKKRKGVVSWIYLNHSKVQRQNPFFLFPEEKPFSFSWRLRPNFTPSFFFSFF